MKEKAQKELERIESKRRTWKTDLVNQIEMWEEIAMEINSTTGEEKQYWKMVMDLYNKKYK